MLPMTHTVLVQAPMKPTMGRATRSGAFTFFRPIHSQPDTRPIMARQPTATQRAFTAPAREVLRKGEKAKDSSAGAMVLLIMEQMPNNAGYTGIVIAYLSRLNPLVIVIVSILFAGLQNSSATVQIMGVPTQIATMIQGAVMIFVIAGDFFQRYKIVVNKEVKA